MKLMVVFLVLLPMLAILAIISRKHFSKYKGGLWLTSRVAGRLQKMEVLYGRSLEDATQQYMEQRFRHFLIMLAVFWAGAWVAFLLPGPASENEEVIRPAAGEATQSVTLRLSDGNEEEDVTLSVEPRQMTEEEFLAAAEGAIPLLKKEMCGKNRDLSQVTTDLILREKDPTGRLAVSWKTDDPVLISRKGTVRREELTEKQEVTVTGELSDGIHTTSFSEKVTVLPLSETESALEKALRELRKQEEDTRKDKEFIIPEQIENVSVSRVGGSAGEKICTLYLGAALITLAVFFMRNGKKKEELKEREKRLEGVFYRFVKRLSLLLAAGENLQAALIRAAEVDGRFLHPEVQYALNRIRTGASEQGVYTELGRNLGPGCYVRLFSTISTAGPRGSSQLLVLLDQEVHEAESALRDEAKRKGEQVQEKLLIPMIILMIVVSGIVVTPAIAGM